MARAFKCDRCSAFVIETKRASFKLFPVYGTVFDPHSDIDLCKTCADLLKCFMDPITYALVRRSDTDNFS